MSFILLTGSSRGIGAATYDTLIRRGCAVIGHQTRPGAPEAVPADVRDPLAAQRLWDEAVDRAGGAIDVLINNAGLFEPNRIERSDLEWLDAWEDTLRINLTASAQLSRLAVRHWQDRRVPGRIVHVASRAAYRAIRQRIGTMPLPRAAWWRCTRPLHAASLTRAF